MTENNIIEMDRTFAGFEKSIVYQKGLREIRQNVTGDVSGG